MSLKIFLAGLVSVSTLMFAPCANAQAVLGDSGDNAFPGTPVGQVKYYGRRGYDKVLYEETIASYGFQLQSNGRVRVLKQNGLFDVLDQVEAVEFSLENRLYELDEIFSPIQGQSDVTVYHGTSGRNDYLGSLKGRSYYSGAANFDTIDYDGAREDYVFVRRDDNSVTVRKPNGDEDRLISIEAISFVAGGQRYGIDELIVIEDTDMPDPNQLTHFGQAVTLVGANIPWSDDRRFSSDFGASDGFGNPDVNLIGFQEKFDQITRNGGNSARVWVHTTGQVSPNIEASGQTIGLSRELTDQQVIDQMTAVLDAAWERGVLVTFSLMSFDMLCDFYENDYGYTGSMGRNRVMLTSRRQDYFDNALTPMVAGLKDHPALFAYEIFNEPEGMYVSRRFCETRRPINRSIAMRFVNEAAAVIHTLDPNVKVTTSTHTELYADFSNESLTGLEGANPAGTLDFYELHWYAGWEMNPFTTPKSEYGLDRPIIIGEYDVEESNAIASVEDEASIAAILANGYAGAWPWSLETSDRPQAIRNAIETARQPALDKIAIETCIRDESASCYNK